jgi:hypothetical protein
MNLTEALAEVKRGLGYRTTLDTSIVGAINSVQRALEKGVSLPDFLLAFDQPITVTANTEAITLPTGFIRMSDKYDMYYIDSDGARQYLPRKEEQEARVAYSGVSDPTFPRVWVRRSDTSGILVPSPSSSGTYYFTFYKAEPILSVGGTISNKWLDNLPDILIGTAGLQVTTGIGYKEGIDYFKQYLARGEKSRMGGIVESELQGRGIVMGRNN